MSSFAPSFKTSNFVTGTVLKVPGPQIKTAIKKRPIKPLAKYGDADKYFDLEDLENTVGSWDMYGQKDEKRYPDLQNEFFERAGSSISRREAIRSLVFLGSLGAAILYGIKGSKDFPLPIVTGAKKSEKGPKGKI